MTRVNGHGPHPHPGSDVPADVLTPLTLSMIVMFDLFDGLMHAPDWPTRRLAAAQIEEHLNCVALDLGAVRTWLALYSPDLRRTSGGPAATGPGDGS